jgi:hypothetical protein
MQSEEIASTPLMYNKRVEPKEHQARVKERNFGEDPMDPTNGMTDFRKRPQPTEVELNHPIQVTEQQIEVEPQVQEVKQSVPSFLPAALRHK